LDHLLQGRILDAVITAFQDTQGIADYLAAVLVAAAADLGLNKSLEFGSKTDRESRRFHAENAKTENKD